jgi:hypothetical protein
MRWRGDGGDIMRMTIRQAAGVLAALYFLGASAGPASAALRPGEFACAGSGGTILIGLGFKILADGTYTDLDGKNKGRVTYSADGATVTFVGGHLNGQVGTGAGNGRNFQIGAISCSHN